MTTDYRPHAKSLNRLNKLNKAQKSGSSKLASSQQMQACRTQQPRNHRPWPSRRLPQQTTEHLNERCCNAVACVNLLPQLQYGNCAVCAVRSKHRAWRSNCDIAIAHDRLAEVQQCAHAVEGRSLAFTKLKHASLTVLWRTGFCDSVRYVNSLCWSPTVSLLQHRRSFAAFLSCSSHADRIT